MTEVYDNTVLFYEAFYKFDVTTLFQMLSPHCRLQNKYGNTARGEVQHTLPDEVFSTCVCVCVCVCVHVRACM